MSTVSVPRLYLHSSVCDRGMSPMVPPAPSVRWRIPIVVCCVCGTKWNSQSSDSLKCHKLPLCDKQLSCLHLCATYFIQFYTNTVYLPRYM